MWFKSVFIFSSEQREKQLTSFTFCRFSNLSQQLMQTPMKPCPMKTHAVDRLVLTARKGSLMELSGPAWQAVSWGGENTNPEKLNRFLSQEGKCCCLLSLLEGAVRPIMNP